MTTEIGTAVTHWTARLAVGLYLVRYLLRAGRSSSVPTCGEAVTWSCGALLFLMHVAAAFHFVHGWSHHAAYVHTAARTADVTGLTWGGGIYFNYAMTVWWPCDALAVSRASHRGRPLPRRYNLLTQLFFGGMMLSATVVFGPAWWLAVAFCWLAAFVGLFLRRRRNAL